MKKNLLLGNFNTKDIEPILSKFFGTIWSKKYYENFKNPERPTCIDLFLINSPHSFQNTMTISTVLFDFHKMIITVLESSFNKLQGREMY